MDTKILCINPGSTSTKIALFENEEQKVVQNIEHDKQEIMKYEHVLDQFDMRYSAIMDFLSENNIDAKTLSAVVGRGGLLPPVRSGAYQVNQTMIDRLKDPSTDPHASNLAAIIANKIAESVGVNAYVYDPVAVCEFIEEAKLSGIPENPRRALSHALNTRAMCHKSAEKAGKKYSEMNFIVCHMGGGLSMNAHQQGRMIDTMDYDEGPFGTETSGRLSLRVFLKLVAKYGADHMKKRTRGLGGVMGHLGTSDMRDVLKMIEDGDKKADLVVRTMAYQIAKGIGELSTTMYGKVDRIILTGGVARAQYLCDLIRERVEFIAPLEVYPGEFEMESLAFGIRRVLLGEEQAREYTE